MGTKFNCHFGYIELPSQILSIEMFEEFIICECEDGEYIVTKHDSDCNIGIKKFNMKTNDR